MKPAPYKPISTPIDPKPRFGNSMNMVQAEGDLNSELQEVLADENADGDARDSKGGAWS
tara:strand:+ start:266 stop:442 length:177 start_codon:yes stop_codon:yes gene_type:complete